MRAILPSEISPLRGGGAVGDHIILFQPFWPTADDGPLVDAGALVGTQELDEPVGVYLTQLVVRRYVHFDLAVDAGDNCQRAHTARTTPESTAGLILHAGGRRSGTRF